MNLLLALLVLVCTPVSFARTAPSSDSAVMEDLFARSVGMLVDSAGLAQNLRAGLTFAGGIEPSGRMRSIAEAVLSSRGLSIADNGAAFDYAVTIALSDLRSAVVKEGRSYRRFCLLTVHLRCADRAGNVLFADGREDSNTDFIPKSSLRETDDLASFSPSSKRVFDSGGPGAVRVLSLVALSAALGYFAFR